MSDSRAIRDARQGSVLARLINRAEMNDTWGDSNEPVEHWFRSLQFALGEILEGLAPTQTGGPPREYAFSECASVLYRIRMVLPTHPDYQVFIADPLVRTEVDTVRWFYCPSNATLHRSCILRFTTLRHHGQSPIAVHPQYSTIYFAIDHVFHSDRLPKSSLLVSKSSSESF